MKQYKQDTDMTDEELWRKIKNNLDENISKLSRPVGTPSSLHMSKKKVHMDDRDTGPEVDTHTAVDDCDMLFSQDTPFDQGLLPYKKLGPGRDVPAPSVLQAVAPIMVKLWGAIMVTIYKMFRIVGPFHFLEVKKG